MRYKVKLLTQKGIIEIIVTPETLEDKQKEVLATYGDFITLSSTPMP